ncbi:MAG: transcriptional repressor [Bacteroidota bacterium]|nr:transcriptional repressor [Bacteroidota bacterium]
MLEKKQIRKTPFRQEVLKLFKASKNAISLKEIERNLTSFDRITLYRTLKLFIEKGLIHEVLHSSGKKYALCKEQCDEHQHQHNHLHFHCSSCKKSFCLETNIKDLNLPGYIIQQTDLSVHGVCKKCNN